MPDSLAQPVKMSKKANAKQAEIPQIGRGMPVLPSQIGQ